MDCGTTCLMMASAAHGRQYPLTYLRERSYLSRAGVSALGIMEAQWLLFFSPIVVKSLNKFISTRADKESCNPSFILINLHYPTIIMNNNSTEPKTKAQLAQAMNISFSTFQRRLKKAGLKIPRGHIPPDLQPVIFEKLGWAKLT